MCLAELSSLFRLEDVSRSIRNAPSTIPTLPYPTTPHQASSRRRKVPCDADDRTAHAVGAGAAHTRIPTGPPAATGQAASGAPPSGVGGRPVFRVGTVDGLPEGSLSAPGAKRKKTALITEEKALRTEKRKEVPARPCALPPPPPPPLHSPPPGGWPDQKGMWGDHLVFWGGGA